MKRYFEQIVGGEHHVLILDGKGNFSVATRIVGSPDGFRDAHIDPAKWGYTAISRDEAVRLLGGERLPPDE